MINRFKNIFLKLLKFSIFLGLLSIVFFSIFAQQPDDRGGILFEVETTPIIQTSAQKIPLLIGLANNFKDRDQLILEDIKINKDDRTIKDMVIQQPLLSVRDKLEQVEFLGQELENTIDEDKGRKILKQVSRIGNEIQEQSFSTSIQINIADFITSPKAGDQFSIKIIASLIHNGRLKKITKDVIFSFASPLPIQTNWYIGDGHVHTGHSELDAAYWYKRGHFFVPGPTVNDQSLTAKNFGLEWLIITDHEEMLDSKEWIEEKQECEIAKNIYNLPVMIGEEVGSIIPKVSQGHYLAYNINSYVDASPFSAQDMIDKTQEAGGFGFIAHPDTMSFPWKDWNITGYKGYELLRGEDKKPKAKTIHRWDDHLEIGQKPVIIGNSDAHWPEDVGKSKTYLYIEGLITHDSIYNALKNRNTVITNGPLLTFTINDVIVGETTNVPPGEQATLNIQWISNEDFGPMKEILVISKDGKVLDRLTKDIQTITGSTTVSYPISEPTYFRLVGKSSNGQVVYTNPVWVTNYPITPPIPWPQAVNVSNNPGSSRFPVIASDVFGHLHVVWEDDSLGNFEILYSMQDGANWSEPLNISNTVNPSLNPSIIIDNFGHPYVVWEEEFSPFNDEIFYTMWGGISWSEPINISNTQLHSGWPDIIIDNLNHIHVVWMDDTTPNYNYDIFYTVLNESGWAKSINISNTSNYSGLPAITVDSYNSPHVVWMDLTLGNIEILYTKKEESQWLSSINISNTIGESRNPDIVSDSANRLHVTWHDFTPGNYEIFYTMWDGYDWEAPFNISKSGTFSGNATIFSDKFNRIHIAWEELLYPNFEIFYSVRNGIWSLPENISNTNKDSRSPSITTDIIGHPHVVWEEFYFDNWEIFYSSK